MQKIYLGKKGDEFANCICNDKKVVNGTLDESLKVMKLIERSIQMILNGTINMSNDIKKSLDSSSLLNFTRIIFH